MTDRPTEKPEQSVRERRRAERQVIHPFGLSAQILLGTERVAGQIKDLSSLGVAVLLIGCPGALEPAMVVQVALSTDLDPEPIHLQAKVVRVVRVPTEKSPALVGLQFVGVDEQTSLELAAFLAVAREAEMLEE